MISRIIGILRKVAQDRVIVDTGNISYEVLVPGNDIQALVARQGEEISLETIFYLAGNLQSGQFTPVLLGFMTEEDREFFERFASVGGIGNRAALRAMARPPREIAQAIEREDYAFLASLPGIGKQRAAKIVAELKGKMGKFLGASDGELRGGLRYKGEKAGALAEIPEIYGETLEVLLQLGHKRAEAEKMIGDAWDRVRSEGRESQIRGSEDMISEIYRLYGDRAWGVVR